jgi:type IV pilus assembly protein PilV
MLRRNSRGFALTEVLVAAALLAVGLLGQLALLVSGLRAERTAANLATAATLAADLGERIRSNSTAGPLYRFDPADTSPATADCALATPIDAATRAACDIEEWRREAAAALPAAELTVNANAIPGITATLFAITIRGEGQGPYGREITLRLQVPK